MEIINAETVNAIKEALVPVADKIGQGASYVWEVVVRQQYVDGIAWLIWSLFTLSMAIGLAILSSFAMKFAKEDKYGDGGWGVAVVFSFIGIFMLLGATFGNIAEGVKHIINPEYYALEFFITLGKSAVTPQ